MREREREREREKERERERERERKSVGKREKIESETRVFSNVRRLKPGESRLVHTYMYIYDICVSVYAVSRVASKRAICRGEVAGTCI